MCQSSPQMERKLLTLFYKASNYPAMREKLQYLRAQGWKIQITHADRGFCRISDKLITIPCWVFMHSDREYDVYYLAHEMAHTIPDPEIHGDIWLTEFIRLCPIRIRKFEIGYRL